MRVVEVRDPAALSRVKDEWRSLHDRCSSATPFQSWEWNEAWWRFFGSRKQLRLLLFYSDQPGAGCCGIAPLYTSRHLGTPIRRLAWLGTGQSDCLGLLAQRENEAEVAGALFDHLESALSDWDMADLQEIAAASPLICGGSSPWPHRPADEQTVVQMQKLPYLDLPATWEEYLGRLGKKLRSNLRYYEKQVQKRWPDSSYSICSGERVRDGMVAFFNLHQSRWKAKWLPGMLGSRRVQEFHCEVAARFDRRGWLRLHLLALNGTPRAALYCYCCHGRTFYYLGGFCPEHSRYSLGTLVTGRAIRTAIEEGCTEFDFLRGDEEYKQRWAPKARVNNRLLLLKPGEGIGALPGRAGLALNRVERYIVVKARELATARSRSDFVQGVRAAAPSGESGEDAP